MGQALADKLSKLVRGSGTEYQSVPLAVPRDEITNYKYFSETGFPDRVEKSLALYDALGIGYDNIHRIPPDTQNCIEAVEERSKELGKTIPPEAEIKTLAYRSGRSLVLFHLLATDHLPIRNDSSSAKVDTALLKSITGMPSLKRFKTGDGSLISGRYDPASFIARFTQGKLEPYGITNIVNIIDQKIVDSNTALYASLGSGSWGVEFPDPSQFSSFVGAKIKKVNTTITSFAQSPDIEAKGVPHSRREQELDR